MAMRHFEALGAALPAYELGEHLGRGSYGTVIAARHRRLHRDVAIKLLPPELMGDPIARVRFGEEARLLAQLDHPHIVRVHDYVEEDDVCALVMERLGGGSLGERMRLGMPAQVACALTIATLNGLEHAHQHGVLHRDVKPDNLLFAAEGLLKVSDFGIAKVLGPTALALTATQSTLGTPAYMAPEQWRGTDDLGPPTDVWAASAVLYELLARTAPFTPRDSVVAMMFARTQEDPIPLEKAADDVPAPVAEAVMHGLERDPGRRPATAAEFAGELEAGGARAWGPEWLSSTAVRVHRTAQRAAPSGAATAAAPAVEAPRRRRGLMGACALAAVAAVGAASVALSSGGKAIAQTIGGPAPPNLPPAPALWPRTMAIGANETLDSYAAQAAKFGHGEFASYDVAGDPLIPGKSWISQGPHAVTTAVQQIHQAGMFPVLAFYVIRAVGLGAKPPNQQDADGPGILITLKNHRRMVAYWQNVKQFLRQLGAAQVPAAVLVDASAWANVITTTNQADPEKIAAITDPAGAAVRNPNSVAGLFQAWVALRNMLAPKVMLGYPIEDYALNDAIDKTHPTVDQVAPLAAAQAKWFKELHAKLDYTDYDLAIPDFGEDKHFTPNNPNDYNATLAYIRDYVRDSGSRLVLDSVPAGNQVTRTDNNTNYHWQDTHAQYLLGEPQFNTLRAYRDAGVIGIDFFSIAGGAQATCPCDAAHDGVSNPGAIDNNNRFSTSSDDDGGYLAMQLTRYRRAGGMLVR